MVPTGTKYVLLVGEDGVALDAYPRFGNGFALFQSRDGPGSPGDDGVLFAGAGLEALDPIEQVEGVGAGLRVAAQGQEDGADGWRRSVNEAVDIVGDVIVSNGSDDRAEERRLKRRRRRVVHLSFWTSVSRWEVWR